MNFDLKDVMARHALEKDSAPDKRQLFSLLCLRPESPDYTRRWLEIIELVGYRFRRSSPVPMNGSKCFFGPKGGGTWFSKFPDYASLRAAALERVAQFLREEAGGEVLLCEDHVGAGMAVARWTSEAFFAGQPTEAIFKPYSMVGGKLCWGEELRGQGAIEFVTSLLQVGLPKPGPILQASV